MLDGDRSHTKPKFPEVAQWFHNKIVCQYGLPLTVWSDKGSEYKGEFNTYLRANGMDNRFTATMNPRSNGLVEQSNCIVKSMLRHFAGACPHGHWWEVLDDFARSFRVLPTRDLGYTPYVLTFKAPAPLAIHHEILQSIDGINWDTAEKDLAESISYWD